MDEIEQKVRLPQGPVRLDAYFRSYAWDEHGKVLASYVIPRPAENHPNWACEELTANGSGRSVPCAPDPGWPPGGAAGKRQWLDDSHSLPFICDGGCDQITVEYDPASRKVTAFCNGEA